MYGEWLALHQGSSWKIMFHAWNLIKCYAVQVLGLWLLAHTLEKTFFLDLDLAVTKI